MAIKRFLIDGFGQVELNQVAFRRDGRIEAQCALDADDFATVPAENGMLLAVDNATRTVKMPEADTVLPIALNYTTEHMYDDRKNALKDFKLDIADGFYPRLGYLAVGDKFTTNCLSYSDADFVAGSGETAEEKVAKAYAAGTTLYGSAHTDGTILISKTAPEASVVLMAVKGTGTMPDGQFGIKFQVIKA